jgi:GGDEF domain-containing protein
VTPPKPRAGRSSHESSIQLEDFLAMAAELTEAHTAALLLEDRQTGTLTMSAWWSLSDYIREDASVSIGSGTLGQMYLATLPCQETYVEESAPETEIYSRPQGIRAYMAAAVGTRGMLWLDTRKAYRFTGKHLKILSQLAGLCEVALDLQDRVSNLGRDSGRLELLRRILDECLVTKGFESPLTDSGLQDLRRLEGVDGILVATRWSDQDPFKVVTSDGFPPGFKRGRLIKIGQGWTQRAVKERQPLFASGPEDPHQPLVLFNPDERLGFDPKSLAVIPWFGAVHESDGLLVVVMENTRSLSATDKEFWCSVGKLVSLMQSAEQRRKLLVGMGMHDGESHLVGEGYFRHVSRSTFSRIKSEGGTLTLLLTLIPDMEDLYLNYEYEDVNLLLESFTDRLSRLFDKRGLPGKFRTGGFGLLLEGIGKAQVERVVEEANTVLQSTGQSGSGGDITHGLVVAAAHYPGDCRDPEGLWRTALSRLDSAGQKSR